MLGILRLRSVAFVDLCKDEILIYLKSTVKQTVIEYVAEFDEEALTHNEDESNLRYSNKYNLVSLSLSQINTSINLRLCSFLD